MKRAIVMAVMLAATLSVEAQRGAQQMPRGKWWTREEVVRRLQLQPAQQTRLDAIFDATANELIDGRANIRKLEIALQAELQRAQLRRPEIQRIAEQLGTARAQLFEREVMMLVDMRGVLDPDQWRLLQATGKLPPLQPFRGIPIR